MLDVRDICDFVAMQPELLQVLEFGEEVGHLRQILYIPKV